MISSAKKYRTLAIGLVLIGALAVATFYGLPTKSKITTNVITTMSSVPADWPTYHGNIARTGFEPNIDTITSVNLGWKSARLDGEVYAEPLIVGNRVIAVTENDSAYSLDADTGRVIWRTNLGAPVNGATLPCGDIDPSGITGTPAIDEAGTTIYTVAFLATSPPHHELFALDLATGALKFHFPIDPPGADPMVQQQRAAVALANDFVYVAYGGLNGDCGSYHGWVVALRTSGNGNVLDYQVPSGRAAGIWAPSGPAINIQGDLFVATGNSDSTSDFDFGNAVIKLSPDLSQLDWFAAPNWLTLNLEDADLGSTGPIILDSNIIFQIGKDGVGYLLNQTNLGGIGGERSSALICGRDGGAYGGSAYAPPYLLIPCTHGIDAVLVNLGSNPSMTVVWQGPNFLPGPPVVAGSSVWTTDVRNGVVYALDLTSGQTIFKDTTGPLTRFTSIGVGGERVFLSANRHIIAYQLGSSTMESGNAEWLLDDPQSLSVVCVVGDCAKPSSILVQEDYGSFISR